MNLGLVNVNPLVSFQLTKDEDGEKVLKPLVNLHVTPTENIVHKVGHLLAAKKQQVTHVINNYEHYHHHEGHFPPPPEIYHPHHGPHHPGPIYPGPYNGPGPYHGPQHGPGPYHGPQHGPVPYHGNGPELIYSRPPPGAIIENSVPPFGIRPPFINGPHANGPPVLVGPRPPGPPFTPFNQGPINLNRPPIVPPFDGYRDSGASNNGFGRALNFTSNRINYQDVYPSNNANSLNSNRAEYARQYTPIPSLTQNIPTEAPGHSEGSEKVTFPKNRRRRSTDTSVPETLEQNFEETQEKSAHAEKVA